MIPEDLRTQRFGGIVRRVEDFGQYIQQLRTDKGLSRPDVRYEVRRRWGISISEDTLILWEGGKTPGIPAVGLACLTLLYGASFNDVFGRLVNAQGGAADGPVPVDDPPADTSAKTPPRRRRGA